MSKGGWRGSLLSHPTPPGSEAASLDANNDTRRNFSRQTLVREVHAAETKSNPEYTLVYPGLVRSRFSGFGVAGPGLRLVTFGSDWFCLV